MSHIVHETPVVVLQLDDGTTRALPLDQHVQSSVIREQHDMCPDANIPLIGVRAEPLDTVLEFMARHAKDPLPVGRMVHRWGPTDTMVAGQPGKVMVHGVLTDLRTIAPAEIPVSVYETGNLASLGVPETWMQWVGALPTPHLFDVMCTAHELGVQPLVYLTAAQAACMTLQMTPEAKRATFMHPRGEDSQLTAAQQDVSAALRAGPSSGAYWDILKKYAFMYLDWTPMLVFLQKKHRMRQRQDQARHLHAGAAAEVGGEAVALHGIFQEAEEEDSFPEVQEGSLFKPAPDLRGTVNTPDPYIRDAQARLPHALFATIQFFS
jgi:hypothetical protein